MKYWSRFPLKYWTVRLAIGGMFLGPWYAFISGWRTIGFAIGFAIAFVASGLVIGLVVDLVLWIKRWVDNDPLKQKKPPV